MNYKINPGDKFNKLTVIEYSHTDKYRQKHYKVKCDCGTEKTVSGSNLRHNKIKSCGCITKSDIKPGDKFGLLTIIEHSHKDKAKRSFFNCKCDCGNEKVVAGSALKGGNTKSCGCILTKPNNYAEVTKILKSYRHGAQAKGLDFDLSREDFENILRQSCHYCGIEKGNSIKCFNGEYFFYNGVDRIDSNKGYTLDNVVACCSKCNYAKRDLPVEDFKEWVTRIYTHLYKADCSL